MKKSFFLLLLLTQCLSAAIQVNENTINRFSFTWSMDELSVADSIGGAAVISFKNQNVELGDSGQPIIPAYSFYVGIPPQGNVQIQCTPLSVQTLTLKKDLSVVKTGKGHSRYPDLTFSDPWLSNGRPARFGAIRGLQCILKPFSYDGKTHTLRVLKRATCIVSFPPSSPVSVGVAANQSDYNQMLTGLILNYSIAKTWPMPTTLSKRTIAGFSFPLSPNSPLLSFTIGDGHDGYNEGTTLENGLVKIPGDSLRKLGQSVLMSQVACFASYKGEMPVTAPDISALPDGISEIPMLRVDVNGNGIVDPEDYVVAYVTGSSDWAWDSAARSYTYNLDRYSDYRRYWITIKQSGAALTPQPLAKTTAPGAAITSFVNHILYRQPEKISFKGGNVDGGEFSGLDWRWLLFKPFQPPFAFQLQLPNIDTAFPARMQITFGAVNSSAGINATFSTAPVCSTCQPSGWYDFQYSGGQTLRLGPDNMNSGDYIEIWGLEFKYITDLDMAGKSRLTVFSPETSSIAQYKLRNLPNERVYIFRIAANEAMRLVDTLQPTQGASYAWSDSAGKGITYFICTQSGLQAPPPVALLAAEQSDNTTIRNLRATDDPSMNKADYLIITHPNFMDQARKLVAHKTNIGRFNYPRVVDVSDIYREFSGGNFDPAAIRNFLVYTNNLWGVKPQYVVLMGRGHYDNKGIASNEPVFIPVYEWADRCTDDFYAYLEPGARVDASTPPTSDIFIGRLPCITADQAGQMVNKIIATEDPAVADLGGWRGRAVLINDDDMQGPTQDALGTEHLEASEAVRDLISALRPAIDQRVVNLFEYPWNSAWEKPEARDALIADINGGAGMVNFFGHGSPTQWADETILNVQLVANLTNNKQFPLISSFSCSVGRFDLPGQPCLSEALVLSPQGGAISALSSMRQAYSDNNKQLALAFYGDLLDSTRSRVTFGEAYTKAKILVRDQNSQIYSYLGDPSISPFAVNHRISLTIANSSGNALDTVKALQPITVKGVVLMNDNVSVASQYGATGTPAFVQLSIFNPPRSAQRKDNGARITQNNPTYILPGTPIFTGQIAVQNGIFSQQLHIPRNVSFNKPGAKAIAFSWQGTDNGGGYKSFIFSGTMPGDSTGIIDTVGPLIAIRTLSSDNALASVPLSADKVQGNLPFKCEIDVVDSSGIDVTATGPDEGLTMEIPGFLSKQNIDNKFSFSGGDFRKGSATVEFGEGLLPPGSYNLIISAQDLAGNVSRHSFSMEISQGQDLAVSRIFNFPNPVKMGQSTSFYFTMSKTSNVRSTIKVYAMSGKLLRVFYSTYSGQPFDCRDQMGNLLGPNVYLYQLTAEDLDQQKTVKSGIQKLVVHPPR